MTKIKHLTQSACPACGRDENGKQVYSLHNYRKVYCAECVKAGKDHGVSGVFNFNTGEIDASLEK